MVQGLQPCESTIVLILITKNLIMENTEWVRGLLGDTRVFNDKYQIRHYNGNIVSFDSPEELEDYLQDYFLKQCDLSSN